MMHLVQPKDTTYGRSTEPIRVRACLCGPHPRLYYGAMQLATGTEADRGETISADELIERLRRIA
jgi:hypothetical protein